MGITRRSVDLKTVVVVLDVVELRELNVLASLDAPHMQLSAS